MSTFQFHTFYFLNLLLKQEKGLLFISLLQVLKKLQKNYSLFKIILNKSVIILFIILFMIHTLQGTQHKYLF